MIQMRDNKSKTQYAYISHSEQTPGGQNNVDGLAQTLPEGLVSFDDERAICDKVHYAQQNKLGGFIIWELCKCLLSVHLCLCLKLSSHVALLVLNCSWRCTGKSTNPPLGHYKQKAWQSVVWMLHVAFRGGVWIGTAGSPAVDKFATLRRIWFSSVGRVIWNEWHF